MIRRYLRLQTLFISRATRQGVVVETVALKFPNFSSHEFTPRNLKPTRAIIQRDETQRDSPMTPIIGSVMRRSARSVPRRQSFCRENSYTNRIGISRGRPVAERGTLVPRVTTINGHAPTRAERAKNFSFPPEATRTSNLLETSPIGVSRDVTRQRIFLREVNISQGDVWRNERWGAEGLGARLLGIFISTMLIVDIGDEAAF